MLRPSPCCHEQPLSSHARDLQRDETTPRAAPNPIEKPQLSLFTPPAPSIACPPAAAAPAKPSIRLFPCVYQEVHARCGRCPSRSLAWRSSVAPRHQPARRLDRSRRSGRWTRPWVSQRPTCTRTESQSAICQDGKASPKLLPTAEPVSGAKSWRATTAPPSTSTCPLGNIWLSHVFPPACCGAKAEAGRQVGVYVQVRAADPNMTQLVRLLDVCSVYG
jgi:hypothetical protein